MKTSELSFDIIPSFEFEIFTEFTSRCDFSPTEIDLSPQFSRLALLILYFPKEKSEQSLDVLLSVFQNSY